MRKKALPNHSGREISVALNNAVTAALRPSGKTISDARLRRLRAYAQALVEPLIEHAEGGVDADGPFPPCIEYHEVVAILVSAAMYVHLSKVVGSDKIPQKYVGDTLYGEEE